MSTDSSDLIIKVRPFLLILSFRPMPPTNIVRPTLKFKADRWRSREVHGLAERVTILHTAVMATVVMCRVRNPACVAASALGKVISKLLRYING